MSEPANGNEIPGNSTRRSRVLEELLELAKDSTKHCDDEPAPPPACESVAGGHTPEGEDIEAVVVTACTNSTALNANIAVV